MNVRLSRLAPALLACAALSGCGSFFSAGSAPAAKADMAALLGTTWVLADLPGARPLDDGKKLAAHLVLRNGEMTGRDGCNAMFGSYELDGRSLTFKQMGATLMMCAHIDGQDLVFRQALENTTAWRLAGDRLELLAGDKMVVRLSRGKAP